MNSSRPPETISSAHGGFRPWGQLADGSALELDAPIRPLVQALNALDGIKTVFSCGGHPEQPDSAARGRRQAHVDVVVRDLEAWRRFARRCRRDAPAAVRALGLAGVSLRVEEGELGPLPEWLKAVLEHEAPAHAPDAGERRVPRAPWWWRRLVQLGVLPERWRYRRLVFEPRPYTMDPQWCRQALDAALQAATRACAEVADI